MSVKVLLFAGLAEKAGTRTIDLPCEEGDTVATVRDRLIACHPEIAAFVPTLMYALNEEYVKPTARVASGDTLALIPPVSGG